MFRLAHLSDPHLPPPSGTGPLRDLFSKRTLSRLAWRRKYRQHDPAVLAGLVADIEAYAPDHRAITGDLTNFSSPEEFAAARVWLEGFGPPDRTTVSPGNHDALVAGGLRAQAAALRPWFGDPGEADFPYARRRGQVAVINLSTAVPTAPLLATGRLGATQLGRLAEMLPALRREGLFRLILIHHPVAPGVVSARKGLDDAPALREILRREGADLVLHGHGHESVFSGVPGPDGTIPVLGAPSASMPLGAGHAAARWNAIEIDGPGRPFQVIARGLDPQRGGIVELGRYRLCAFSADIAA